jgi:hypothetical protein
MFVQAIEESMAGIYAEFINSDIAILCADTIQDVVSNTLTVEYTDHVLDGENLHPTHDNNTSIFAIRSLLQNLHNKFTQSLILLETGNPLKMSHITLKADNKGLHMCVVILKEKTRLTFKFDMQELKKKMVFTIVSGTSENIKTSDACTSQV